MLVIAWRWTHREDFRPLEAVIVQAYLFKLGDFHASVGIFQRLAMHAGMIS